MKLKENNLPTLQVVLPKEYSDQIYQQVVGLTLKAVQDTKESIGLINKPFLNRKELKLLLSCGDGTIDDLIVNHGLEVKKLGRQRLFSYQQVLDIINKL